MHPVNVINNIGHFNNLVFRMPRDLDLDTTVEKSGSPLMESREFRPRDDLKAMSHETETTFALPYHSKAKRSVDQNRVYEIFNAHIPVRA
jgi:hypothetical protein